MKETKRKFYKKICKWKKQILCVGAGIFLGIAAWLAQGMDPVIEAGNVIQRPDIDDGQVDQELYVKGLVDQEKEVVLKLPVSARQYTKEEAYQAYEEILKQLPEWIKGDNLSLEEVRQDLELPAYWQGAGVHLSWQSSDPELVESDGTVHTWEFETGDEAIDQWPVILKVRMTDGNWPEEYEIPIKVRPPLYTEEERTIQEFTSLLTSEEEVQKHQDQVTLPSVYKDREISYSTAREPLFLQMCFLGAVAAVFISLKEKSDKKKAEEERKDQLLMDYSEVLSRLIIFLGAGMSIRTAWDRIAEDYKMAVKEGRRGLRYVYEEMYVTSSQLKSGESEARAFAEFGNRCGLQQYRKFSGLLEQNRKNGSKNLRETLRLEMADAFEQRKHQAKRMGEKAGTKLLIPLFLLLAVVMAMITVPAWIAFG